GAGLGRLIHRPSWYPKTTASGSLRAFLSTRNHHEPGLWDGIHGCYGDELFVEGADRSPFGGDATLSPLVIGSPGFAHGGPLARTVRIQPPCAPSLLAESVSARTPAKCSRVPTLLWIKMSGS